jgi:hypothetical protein
MFAAVIPSSAIPRTVPSAISGSEWFDADWLRKELPKLPNKKSKPIPDEGLRHHRVRGIGSPRSAGRRPIAAASTPSL